MALRAALLVSFLIAGVVVDGAWLSRLPFDATPDLLLLIVLAAAFRHGVEAGALLGALAGYLRDLIGGSPLGLFALPYLMIGAAAGAVSPMIDLQRQHVPAAAALIGTVLLALLVGMIVMITGLGNVRWVVLARDAAIGAVLNAFLAGLCSALVSWADRVTQRRYDGRTIGHRVLR